MNTTASKITMLRVAMIPVFLVLAYTDHRIIATVVFILASLSDLLDGYVARHYNQVSNFGKFMDPLADKILVLSAMCFREFAVSGLRLVAAEKQRVIAAAWSGKVKTTCTMVGLCFMLVFTQYPWLNMLVSAVILITTVYSGVEYFMKNKDVLKDAD